MLEVADCFVVNKADRPGADAVVETVRQMLHLSTPRRSGWAVPVIRAVAVDGSGVDELVTTIKSHQAFLAEAEGPVVRRRQRAAAELRVAVWARALAWARRAELDDSFGDVSADVAAARLDARRAADELLGAVISDV